MSCCGFVFPDEQAQGTLSFPPFPSCPCCFFGGSHSSAMPTSLRRARQWTTTMAATRRAPSHAHAIAQNPSPLQHPRLRQPERHPHQSSQLSDVVDGWLRLDCKDAMSVTKRLLHTTLASHTQLSSVVQTMRSACLFNVAVPS